MPDTRSRGANPAGTNRRCRFCGATVLDVVTADKTVVALDLCAAVYLYDQEASVMAGGHPRWLHARKAGDAALVSHAAVCRRGQ